MKLLYTNENRFIASNVQNIVQNAGIEITLKNEYIAGAAGDLSPFDTWLELWVEDADYARAIKLVEELEKPLNTNDWICHKCGETNVASFEICWNCQTEKQNE